MSFVDQANVRLRGTVRDQDGATQTVVSFGQAAGSALPVPSFDRASSFLLTNFSSSRTSFDVGDFSGDGRVDVVAANPNTDTLLIYTNGSAGLVLHETMDVADGMDNVQDVQLIDVTGNGSLDLVAMKSDSIAVKQVLGTPVGGSWFGATQTSVVSPTANFQHQPHRSAAHGDFVENGCEDLLLPGGGFSRELRLAAGDCSGNFAVSTLSVSVEETAYDIGIGHIDMDTHLDIVLSDSGLIGQSLVVGYGDGAGGLLREDIFNTGSLSFAAGIAVGDPDLDGDDDVIVGLSDADSIAVYESTPLGLEGPILIPSNDPLDIILADVNTDGQLDIVTAGDEIRVLAGNGLNFSGNIGFAVFASNLFAGGAAAADFDNDGFIDLAHATTDVEIMLGRRG